MRIVSVRALIIVLSLTLVMCTAAICLSLSLTTAEDAITKTEEYGQRGLDSAFASAEISVRDITDSYLDELASNVYHFTVNALEVQKGIVSMMTKYLQPLADTPSPTEGIEMFDFYSVRDRMRPLAALSRAYGTPGVEFTNRRGQWIAHMEDDVTVANDLGYHIYYGLFNNATMWGGTMTVAVPVDDQFESIVPAFKCTRATLCRPNPDDVTFPYDALDPSMSVLMYPIPAGVIAWSPVLAYKGFIGVSAFSVFHSTIVPAAWME
eukprot:PhM_4_TR7033/c0_g2_i1/m.46113